MNTILTKVVGIGISLLLILLSGFWLSRSGKPYSVIVFTLHKIIGLGTVIFLATIVYKNHQVTPMGPVQALMVGLTLLLFVVTFASGGFLSVDKEFPAAVHTLHLIAPVLTVFSTAATLYLILRGS